MKTLLRFTGGLALVGALLFSACQLEINTPDPVLITWEAAANGSSTADSTAITFTFSAALAGLNAGDITLTNGTGIVTKGGLTGGGTSWSLAIAVQTAGDVKVKIAKAGVDPAEKPVTVYKAGAQTSYTAAANGANNTADSTAITFTFNEAVTGLSAGDITLTNGTGQVTKGALTGAGQNWSLGITVQKAGGVTVKITKDGVDAAEKTLQVYKAGEETGIITYTAAANGSNTADSSAITFTFNEAVTDLSAENITLTDGTGQVTKGELTGGGTSWSLGITVQTAGNVTVQIAKAGVETAEKAVTVFKAGVQTPIGYTVAANGAANTTDSSVITFTFGAAVTGLSAGDITLTNGTGEVTKGVLSGAGQNWSLGITVQTAGNVTVKITKAGVDPAEKTVTVHKAPTLTPAIQFYNGQNANIATVSGNDTAWNMDATEQSTVYFGVYKEAAQTITVSGTDAAKVSAVPDGMLGSTAASDEFAVYTVDTKGLEFDGGTRTFTLNVSETGALPRSVAVTLNVETTYQTTRGAAVFRHEADGALTRLGDNFDGLVKAFEWLETNAQADTEYTIRVEKDETSLPRLVVGLNNAENAALRLKGTKDGPKTLKHLGSGNIVVNKSNLSTATTSGPFIQIGPQSGNKSSKQTFILGNNITVEGMTTSTSTSYLTLIGVGFNATLVLEEGSKITNFDSSSLKTSDLGSVIFINAANIGNSTPDSAKHGKIRIEGGEISNCKVYGKNDYSSLIEFARPAAEYSPGSLYLAPNSGLVLQNNTNADNDGFNKAEFFYTDKANVYDLTQYLVSGLSKP